MPRVRHRRKLAFVGTSMVDNAQNGAQTGLPARAG